MLRRQSYIALAGVFFLVVVVLALPGHRTAQLRTGLAAFFLPLFGLARGGQAVAQSSEVFLLPRRALGAELEKLREENQRLRLQQMQAAQIWHENQQLRHALELRNQMPWNPKLARVAGRDPVNWWRTLQIDLGSRAGVRPNLPVLTLDGLLAGRISHVGLGYSQVVLVGDPNCQVSAQVEETRDHGVITAGASLLNPSIVILTHLDRQSRLQSGQRVVTSGLGELFPKGIRIGEVLDVTSVGYGLSSEARVKLAADLQQLDYVWVLFP